MLGRRLFYRIGCALTFIAAVAMVFFVPDVFAQTGIEEVGNAAGINTGRDLFSIIGTVINVFFSILGIIFLLLVLYAGFLWMTAAGNPDSVDKAKRVLIQAVVGLVITLSAFAITTFILGVLNRAGLIGGDGNGLNNGIESLSGSLGAGAIRDHYPPRFGIDIPRNTKIFVTFKEAMDIASFIEGYSTAGTPLDVSDDSLETALNVDNILIYVTADGEGEALETSEVTVAFTEDLKTFVFDPPVLGSPNQDVNYTVYLSDSIRTANGDAPINLGGYQWTFTVGTELDVTPPVVTSVTPFPAGTYDRNIVVQVDFSEAIDPTASTGTTAQGFENIQALSQGTPVAGSYLISNGYRTITFQSSSVCGTNSCGETLYCLPGNADIETIVYAATPGTEPPQAVSFPYDGIVDVVGNSLDGDGDWGQEGGEVGDDYAWQFSTTNDINLSAPEIETVLPSVLQEDIALDAPVEAIFGCSESSNPNTCDSVLMSSTVSSEFISLSSGSDHELWYRVTRENLDADGVPVNSTTIPSKTRVVVPHGIFLESVDDDNQLYQLTMTEQLKNQYQNCFAPAEGPNAVGGRCGTTESQPYCCNGIASANECAQI